MPIQPSQPTATQRWPLRSLRFLPVYTACKRTRVRTLETRAHTTHMHTRACSHHAHAHARVLTRAFSPHAGPQPADTRARGVGTRPVTASGWGVAGKGGESRIAPPSTLRERQAPEASALNLSAPRKEWAAGKAAASPTDVRTQTSCPLIASSAHGTWAGGSEHAQSAPCAPVPPAPTVPSAGLRPEVCGGDLLYSSSFATNYLHFRRKFRASSRPSSRRVALGSTRRACFVSGGI